MNLIKYIERKHDNINVKRFSFECGEFVQIIEFVLMFMFMFMFVSILITYDQQQKINSNG